MIWYYCRLNLSSTLLKPLNTQVTHMHTVTRIAEKQKGTTKSTRDSLDSSRYQEHVLRLRHRYI